MSRHEWGGAAHSLFLDGGAVTTKDELLRRRCEVSQAGNGQILVVEVRVLAEDLVGLSRMVSTKAVGAAEAGALTFFTTGRTHGLALLSLYAPMPRSTLLLSVSRR
jgi:hypothetical protein